jgi:hypothetical protein
LNRQAAKFHTVQTLLQPQSTAWSAFQSAIPWGEARVATYVLRQDGHDLVQSGFLQVRKRQGRPETDILALAPSLDARTGHPAIWHKLLSHYIHEASFQGLERIYADVPEQPLLVNTFAGVGFQPYCRQTIWRLFVVDALAVRLPNIGTQQEPLEVRPAAIADGWTLAELYRRTVPEPVRRAEGGAEGVNNEGRTSLPIVENWQRGQSVMRVAVCDREVQGAFEWTQGPGGTWLWLWVDTLNPDQTLPASLLCHALATAKAERWNPPLYFGVSDFQEGLNALLSDCGFAPVSDHVKMVKHVIKRLREPVSGQAPVVEPTSEVVPTTFRTNYQTSNVAQEPSRE